MFGPRDWQRSGWVKHLAGNLQARNLQAGTRLNIKCVMSHGVHWPLVTRFCKHMPQCGAWKALFKSQQGIKAS